MQAKYPQNSEADFRNDGTDRAETGRPETPKTVGNATAATDRHRGMDSFLNVELPISVSFGNLEMSLEDVTKLDAGSVVELDKFVNDPVTILVNHTPIARGEMVVVGDNYGVRILEVEKTEDRIRSLK
jgi:flagellar motor switch protein FliN/FliY